MNLYTNILVCNILLYYLCTFVAECNDIQVSGFGSGYLSYNGDYALEPLLCTDRPMYKSASGKHLFYMDTAKKWRIQTNACTDTTWVAKQLVDDTEAPLGTWDFAASGTVVLNCLGMTISVICYPVLLSLCH